MRRPSGRCLSDSALYPGPTASANVLTKPAGALDIYSPAGDNGGAGPKPSGTQAPAEGARQRAPRGRYRMLNNENPDRMTVQELAELWQVSQSTIQRAI